MLIDYSERTIRRLVMAPVCLGASALWRNMDQAAENEGTPVLLDPVGGHQIHLAAEQFFQAIG